MITKNPTTELTPPPRITTTAGNAFGFMLKRPDAAVLLEAVFRAALRIRHETQFSSHSLCGTRNSTGDHQSHLDMVTHDIIVEELDKTGVVRLVYSEEAAAPIVLNRSKAALSVVFDPLDGSKNQRCGWPMGTIVGIFDGETLADAATRMIASVMVVYSSKLLVAIGTPETGVHLVELQENGHFESTPDNRRLVVPANATHALLGGKLSSMPSGLLDSLRDLDMGVRTSGCLAAEALYILCSGGVFVYPTPKLRSAFEILPVGFLMKCAGGSAFAVVDGIPVALEDLTDITPESKAAFVSGSTNAVQNALAFFDPDINSFSA